MNFSSPGSLVFVCEQTVVAGLLVSGRVGTFPDLRNNLMSKPRGFHLPPQLSSQGSTVRTKTYQLHTHTYTHIG